MISTLPAGLLVDLADVARLARECTVMRRAHRLAQWLAEAPRRVTPTKVLSPSEVPSVGAALGFTVPDKVRRAGDISELRQSWAVATVAGLVKVSGSRATPGPALETWSQRGDEAVLDEWLTGLRATSIVESESRRDHDVAVLIFALLDLVAVAEPPTNEALWGALHQATAHADAYGGRYAGSLERFYEAATEDTLGKLFALLGDFGATTGGSSDPVITPLGRWALAQFQAALPQPIEPELTAGEVLARLVERHDHAQAWRELGPWLEKMSSDRPARWLTIRTPEVAAREILAAAVGATPSERLLARYLVDGWGDAVLPVWQEVVDRPDIGPHARAVLAIWDNIEADEIDVPNPETSALDPADEAWVVIDGVAAALAHPGPDEALTLVYEAFPDHDLEARIAAVRDSGHPEAEMVSRALTEFIASGVARSVDQVLQLKVTLTGWRPPIWRRVLLPATFDLADLHLVIQKLYGWDGDHLHAFTVGEKYYSDALFGLEEAGDEDGVRLPAAFAQKTKKIQYLYDFGANWQHEIVLEQVLERQDDQPYPTCVAYNGDSPDEYPNYEDEDDEDEDEDDEDDVEDGYGDDRDGESAGSAPKSFDLAEVNHRLLAEV